MKQVRHILVCILLCAGCEPAEPAKEDTRIVDNLPIPDRDLLLEPLESALEDLRESILQDESHFSSSYAVNTGNVSATVRFKLDGADTLMVSVEAGAGTLREYHEQFFDDGGYVFYSFHRFEQTVQGVDARIPLKEYKFYFEDKGVQLSAYARVASEGGDTGEWTPVCLTPEEEKFIRGRLDHLKHLQSATRL